MTTRHPQTTSTLTQSLSRFYRDQNYQLWITYQKRSGSTYRARLFTCGPQIETAAWVGKSFDIHPDKFLWIAGTRERRSNAVRLDNCTPQEIAGLFEDATIPFELWNPPTASE